MDSLLLEPPGAYLRYLDVPGVDVPVVWLHGLGCASSADFPSIAADPSLTSHRSVLIDLLGHGFSDAPEQFSYTMEDHARSVAQLLDHLSLKGCAVFGHSMGGSVAIALTALRPDLVSNLIIAEANLDPGGGTVSTMIAEQTEHDFERTGHPALLEWFLGKGWVTRVATFRVASSLGLYRSAVDLVKGTRPSWRELLYDFRIPRASLFGELGLADPDTERLASQGIEILVVPNSGHDMVVDNPAGLAERIARALQVTATAP